MKNLDILQNNIKINTIHGINIGECFKLSKNKGADVYMRIHPTNLFFNSTMISEIDKRGDIFAVNLRTGIFTSFYGLKTAISLNIGYSESKQETKEGIF